MRIAITGGSGFVGSHIAERLLAEGHEVVLIARSPGSGRQTGVRFVPSDLSDAAAVQDAFTGCDAVAHCAGINREIGQQTYQRVHVQGTEIVVEAARRAGVKKAVLMSFLRARPACGSAYHESKWAAEELVRHSGLDFTILKSGMVYGQGDHMLDHLSHSFFTLPVLATVGFQEMKIRPVAVDDLTEILRAALVDGRLSRQTVAVAGAEELSLSQAARRVASVLGKKILVFRAPVWFHYLLAGAFELTMKIPLVAKAQVRILAEGVVEPMPPCDSLPADLVPKRMFTEEQIRSGLPERGPFGLSDLRCCLSHVP